MTNRVTIRRALCDEYDVIADVMYDAVRHGPSAYSQAQRQAWVPEPRKGEAWSRRLNAQAVFVAAKSGSIVGFMTLADEGYIDFAYIRPDAQGTGIFRSLFQAVESQAKQARIHRMWVHASLNAQPAFAAVGFSITQMESVEIGDQTLQRVQMEKRLGSAKSK